jgi:hypothetical protein
LLLLAALAGGATVQKVRRVVAAFNSIIGKAFDSRTMFGGERLSGRGGFFVGANSFAKQAEGLPCGYQGAAPLPLANEFAPTGNVAH